MAPAPKPPNTSLNRSASRAFFNLFVDSTLLLIAAPVQLNRLAASLKFSVGATIISMKTEAEVQIISRSPDIMSGAPVFAGTRVPVQTIIDYLAGGHPLDEFLDDFPTVRREQALELLWRVQEVLAAAHIFKVYS